MGPGVEPGEPPAELFHGEVPLLEVEAVEVGDLQFSPGGGPEAFRQFHDMSIVEVQAGHGVVGFRAGRLFFEGQGPVPVVEIDNAVLPGVLDPVGEDCSPRLPGGCPAELLHQAVAEEDVVPQIMAQGSPLMKSFPMRNAWARPSGLGWTAYRMDMPH